MLLVAISRTVRALPVVVGSSIIEEPLKLGSPTLVRPVAPWRNNIHHSLPQLPTIPFPSCYGLWCLTADVIDHIIRN